MPYRLCGNMTGCILKISLDVLARYNQHYIHLAFCWPWPGHWNILQEKRGNKKGGTNFEIGDWSTLQTSIGVKQSSMQSMFGIISSLYHWIFLIRLGLTKNQEKHTQIQRILRVLLMCLKGYLHVCAMGRFKSFLGWGWVEND